jgi:hypothetical protein
VPSLSYETLTVLALAAIAGCVLVAIALTAVALRLWSRVREVHERQSRLLGGSDHEDLLAAVDRHLLHVQRLGNATELLSREVAVMRQRASALVRTPGVVRYDAFDVPSGQQSFSAALVNEAGDGLVLTGLNSRTETRVYAKPIVAAGSAHNLSLEEERAIGLALGADGTRLDA